MSLDIFIQTLGFVAIAFNLIAVQFNTHAKIVAMKTVGSFLFGVQYFLLHAYTGVVMEVIGWIRNFIFMYVVKKNKPTRFWIVFFSCVTFGLGVTTILLTWEKSLESVKWLTDDFTTATILTLGISVLSIIAKILSTVAYGINSAHKIRMLNLPSCSCWLVYNFIAYSLAGILNEIMCLISINIAEIRFRTPKNKTTTTESNNTAIQNE